MTKILRTLALALLLPTVSAALADGYKYFTVKYADGTETSFPVKGLRLMFDGGDVAVYQNGILQKNFAASTVTNFYYTTEATGINASQVGQTALPKYTKAKIYSTSGQLIRTTTTDAAGYVDTSDLQTGLYLIKAGKKTLKISVK